MKFTTRILALCILLIAMVGCSAAKVGTVQPERLFQDSASGKAGMEHLRQIEMSLQAQLTEAQTYIEENPNNEALRNYLQTTFQNYQQTIVEEQQKVMESINDQIQNALDSLREKEGYSVLINEETTLSSSPDMDVTGSVLEEMDMTPLSFTPFSIDELAVPIDIAKMPKN